MFRIRKYHFILLVVAVSWNISAAQFRFPYDYTGVWNGELEIYAGTKKVQSIPMQLSILNTPEDSVFIYQLKYGEGEQADIRDYQMNVLDPVRGLYEIDEKNSIVLTAQRFHNKILSSFVVQGSVIQFIYNLYEDRIHLEVYSGPHEVVKYTGGGEDSPEVGIIQNNVYQSCELRRKE